MKLSFALPGILCLAWAVDISFAFLFQVPHSVNSNIHSSQMETTTSFGMAKGFGAGSSSRSSSGSTGTSKKVKKSTAKKTQQRILKEYGGDIVQGTQRRVEQMMRELPPHVQMATQLYQQLQQWNARLAAMSILEQTQQISEQDLEGARRAQQELERVYQEHNLSEHKLHNVFQQITWDASADAKAARALTGDMPSDIQARIDRVCDIVAETVKAAGPNKGRCLDIGCGYGVLVPFLIDTGLAPSQIHGIDLSPEMIRNAREQNPRGVVFEAADFMNDYTSEEGFDSVIFCSALHDLSDMTGALQKAARLVRRGSPNNNNNKGKLVIAHPQGASHVLKQSAANPVLVKRGLPTAEELKSMDLDGLKLEIEPAKANSPQESKEGYLAVLTR